MSNTVTPEIVESIKGTSYLAIQSAMTEFLRRIPDVVGYQISVIQEDDVVVVSFVDQDAPAAPDTAGSLGQKPAVAVELDARNLRVLRAYYQR